MRFLIDFSDNTSTADIDAYLSLNNLTKIKDFSNYKNVFLVEGAAMPSKTDIVEEIVEDDLNGIQLLDYVYVHDNQPSGTTDIDISDDKNWWKVASINPVDFDKSINTIPLRGKNTFIYLMDSGVDGSHPEFVGRTVINLFSFNNDFTDTRGHGTALASLMIGNTCGLTDAVLKSVKIFDSNQPTLLSDLIHALDSIISDFIASGSKPSTVNMSWNIPRNSYVDNKIIQLASYGLQIVVSAGNSGQPIEDVTPAGLTVVNTIGAYSQQLTPCDFSNYTGSTMLDTTSGAVNDGALNGWGPGERLYAAGLNGTYGYIAGTSGAAAIVTGAFAYDLDLLVTSDDGQLVQFPGNAQRYVFKRRDMLVLTDKYANSKNIICTYTPIGDVRGTQSIRVKDNSLTLAGMFNRNTSVLLYDNTTYTTVSATNLPAGLTIKNGYIYGYLAAPAGVSDTAVETYTYDVVLSGPNTEDLSFTITHLFAVNFDSVTDEFNKQLNITLDNAHGCSFGFIPGWSVPMCLSNGNCAPYCTGRGWNNWTCSGSSPKTCSCYCY